MSLPEVHGHGDGELLVVDGENVQNLDIDGDVHGRVPLGGLQLLVVLRQAPAQNTLHHPCMAIC